METRIQMAQLIHITSQQDEASILRNGIHAAKRQHGPREVLAMPVLPNFSITHQWSGELR
jgi:hypothetical protein